MLYRHPTDKLIGGVCGGVAEYLNWNPVIVRVLWVVATFATWGGGIMAYLLLAMFLPTGTNAVGQLRPPAVEMNQKGVTWAAGLLIGFGGLWLLLNLGILPGMWRVFWGLVGVIFWPALLIGAGYLLLRANRQSDLNQDMVEAARKMKESMGEKLPSSDQVKARFASLQQSMPLQRSRSNRMFMGVCGGIAEKFGMDVNLVRLIWAAFAIGTMGLGALLYGFVGVLLPEAGEPADARHGVHRRRNRASAEYHDRGYEGRIGSDKGLSQEGTKARRGARKRFLAPFRAFVPSCELQLAFDCSDAHPYAMMHPVNLGTFIID